MESRIAVSPHPALVQVLRWTARLGSIASIVILSMFLFGEFGTPTLSEWFALAMFPFGVAAGMVIAWRREILGGAFSLIMLAGLYAWMVARDGHIPHGPYFVLFTAPAFIFLACGLLDQRRVRD